MTTYEIEYSRPSEQGDKWIYHSRAPEFSEAKARVEDLVKVYAERNCLGQFRIMQISEPEQVFHCEVVSRDTSDAI